MRTAPSMLLSRTRLFASVLVVALAVSLASCASGGSTTPVATGNANVRFLNGSPDAGAIDVLVNGKAIVSNLAYGQLSAYQSIAVGTTPLPQVAFVKTGTTTNIFPPLSGGAAQTFQLGAVAGTNLTVVVEGEVEYVGARGITLGSFIEPTITNTSGTYAIVFHHASPSAALAAPSGLSVGQIALGASPTFTVLGSMLFSTTAGNSSSLFGLVSQPAVTGPPGVGFYVGPTVVVTPTPTPVITTSPTPTPTPTSTAPAPVTSPTIYAAIVPGPPTPIPSSPGNPFPVVGVDSTDVNQSLPFNAENTLFVYVIDSTTSPTGVTLVGTFNNNPSPAPTASP
jgi:hypothetical protein